MFQSSYAQTHRGIKKKINEDAFLKMPDYGIWAVADGMGGHPAGDLASQLILDDLEKAVTENSHNDLNCQIIIDSLQNSNYKLLKYAQKRYPGMSVGSTVVILFIKDETSHLLWVGDSRGYLFRKKRLYQLTKDHTEINDMLDFGMLDPSEANKYPLSNVITRAVGAEQKLEIEVVRDHLEENDILLLCSDGLTNEMTNSDIEQILQSVSIVDSGMALVHSSLVREAHDDVTCILVKYQNENKFWLESNIDTPISFLV